MRCHPVRSVLILLSLPCGCVPSTPPAEMPGDIPANSTFANPLDLGYRFSSTLPSHRSAADPVIVLHNDDYYLFASATDGYWRSEDLRDWSLIIPEGLPLEEPAPAVLSHRGRLYYTAHRSRSLYVSDDPAGGRWTRVTELDEYADPALFLDDDGRVYLYYGAALNGSVSVVELNPERDFRVAAGPFRLLSANFAEHGWERSGPENLGAEMSEGFRIAPWIEGPWMTKHGGTYYLQYSAPGTVWKTYADGVYTSGSPSADFVYAPYSPFSYKPGGFVGSAGHGAIFQDRHGRYWRVVTLVISIAHRFERRIGIFPAGFDDDGVLRTATYLGDYPQFLPGLAAAPLDGNLTGWMLLSGGKTATASSALQGRPAEHAFDEDIRTHWSARSASPGEWLQVDLGGEMTVRAVQLNFAEEGTTAIGPDGAHQYRYLLQASRDGQHWWTLVDRSLDGRDAPHEYVQLDRPAGARHLRISNVQTPAGGNFALRDLRVFGRGTGPVPAAVQELTVRRDPTDPRSASLAWTRSAGARGYLIRFGIGPDKLYAHHQVGDVDAMTLNALNTGVPYYFVVDAFNETGVTKGEIIRRVDP